MPTPSTTGTQTRQRRSLQGLLSSGSKLSALGVLAAVATLSFVVWMQYAIRRQTEVAEPLARASLQLVGQLDRSFVALHLWVAYGDRAARDTRSGIWNDEIVPRLEVIKAAALASENRRTLDDVETLRTYLRQLKYWQWSVEDIARTPGNVYAQAFYERELVPVRTRAGLLIDRLLQGSQPGATESALLRLRSALVETDHALTGLLVDYSPAQAVQARRLAQTLLSRAAAFNTAEMADSPLALRELRAYVSRVAAVVDARGADDWNQADHLYRTELKPVQAQAVALAERISAREYAAVEASSRQLFHWSFLVLALAVILGTVSGSSLYVSYRLEDRVERALAKAKSLGQYVIEEWIGGGGMGQVYRARHALLRRPSAIKVLRTESMADPRAQQRFAQEVRITSQLTHPNTIAIFDYGRTPEGMFYYVMELLDGANLQHLVELTGPLPSARVIHILTQICGSLSEAHRKGLLHRDIKPSNVMLTELGGVFDTVKVLDFGLVKQISDLADGSANDRIVGTPAYLAPEIIEADHNASPKSEVYAMGAVGYYLLTGTPVFDNATMDQVLRAQLEEAPEPVSRRLGASVNENLEWVLMRCLDKDPNQRPDSVSHLAALLREAEREVWTALDAEIWWEQYGEAVRAEARAQGAAATLSKPSLDITRGKDP